MKRYAASRIKVNPNSFDREVIQRVVHEFYTRKKYPTLSGVLEEVKEQCGFPGGRFCMWRVLQELGYSYKKKDNKQFIYEQHNILKQRHTYLQTIWKLSLVPLHSPYLNDRFLSIITIESTFKCSLNGDG